jgi:hypothetical protein
MNYRFCCKVHCVFSIHIEEIHMSMRFPIIVGKQAGTFFVAMLTMLLFNGSVEAGIGSAQKKALDSDSIVHANGLIEAIADDSGTSGHDGDGDDNGTSGHNSDGDDNGTSGHNSDGDDNGTGGHDSDGDDNGTGRHDSDGDDNGTGRHDSDGADNGTSGHDDDGDDHGGHDDD